MNLVSPKLGRPSIYQSNFKAFSSLLALSGSEYPKYLRLTSKGFMPLTFDRLPAPEGTIRYAMAHWYEQNGDLIQDPEMIVEIRGESLEALSIQHAPPFNFVREVYVTHEQSGQRTAYYPRQKKEQNDFLKVWLRNIKDQGFGMASDEEG